MTDADIHRIILGAIIHRRRVDIGMNQTELAERILRTQSMVSRIERGNVSLDFFLARKIEEVLECTMRDLIEIVFERAVDVTIACLPTATRENWTSEAVRVAGLDGFIDGPITFAVAAVLMEKWPRRCSKFPICGLAPHDGPHSYDGLVP